ncbi:alpha/beta hydrolase [Primorskyibacter sp. 2E107]|uniref:alpha/beta hydrolase n=1 Tax=Primorskyibacter sp. 2E107 TaxID=3403458 RepID=UPI003AF989E1
MKFLLTTVLCASGLAGASMAQVSQTPDIAAKLPDLGRELSREMVGGTKALYAPLHAAADETGLSVQRDLSYGPDARNMLDVYAPEAADGSNPVMIFVHGGGFVRGDKADVAGIGRWFARNGVVAVTMNYRLAPDHPWPSGAEDVRAALEWIGARVANMGGDPSKVFVVGNSAGAMHVADYVFREDLQAEDDGVIGTTLISPPTVDLTARDIDPSRDALYYGIDGDRSEQSVVNALEGRKIPVMIAYAEHEPDVIIKQTRLLIEALATRDGRLPLITGVPGHNHISIVEHIGTADQSLAFEMLSFMTSRALEEK